MTLNFRGLAAIGVGIMLELARILIARKQRINNSVLFRLSAASLFDFVLPPTDDATD